MSEYVAKIERNMEPGGLMLDFVFLKNGKFLAISDKSIFLCETQKDFESQREDRQSISIENPLQCSTSSDWNYIEKVELWDTGGNVLVDILRLKGDRFIGISDECVILYDNEDHFYDGEYEDQQIISLEN